MRTNQNTAIDQTRNPADGKSSMPRHAATPVARRLSRTTIALLVGSLLAAPLAFAQSHSRFGTPELYSPLGSPLLVRIPVEAGEAGDDLTLPQRYRLGSAPTGAGVPFLENAEITLERNGREFFIVVRSRQAVLEPAVGIVIREQLASGSRSREFVLLPDPPNLFVARALPSSAAPATYPATATAAAGIAAPVAPPVIAAAVDTPARAERKPRSARTRTEAARIAAADGGPAVGAREGAARAANPVPRAPKAKSSSVAGNKGPRLALALSADALQSLPHATEAERAELRMRQLMMDTDDLRSALLERRDRIARLEKELGDLTSRVQAAEQAVAGRLSGNLSTNLAGVPAAPAVTPVPANAAAPTVTAAENATPATPAVEPAAPATAPAAVAQKTPVERRPEPAGTPWWQWLLLTVGGTALLLGAWRFAGRFLRARDEALRLSPEEVEQFVADAPVVKADYGSTQGARQKATPVREPVAEPAPPVPEIQFELPDVPSHLANPAADPAPINWSGMTPADTVAEATPLEAPAAPVDELGARRQRYLEARYHDIAILNPPLDAPVRLLRQASRLYDEGAADFAKRMLKYAAYSRPYTEEFWLALAELLYREKFASDYVVNARWFRRYHTRSTNWEEIQRIGYLLDPAEPMFASAASWSHDAPDPGRWLPKDEQLPALADPFPTLQLQLAS